MENEERLKYDEQVIEELKDNVKSLEKRILTIEISREKTDYQYEQIMENLKTLNEKTIPNLVAEINALKEKPAKRYDSIISGILGAIAGGVGTAIASIFINKN